jgi:YVTN family beta-propeller protein
MRGSRASGSPSSLSLGARVRRGLAVLLLGLGGCALAGRPPVSEPPLLDEGKVLVYLTPIPQQGRRLSFAVERLTAVREGGEAVPLQVHLPAIVASELSRDERLLASGRLPPGRYLGLRLAAAGARLAGEGRATDLLVGPEPARVEVPFDVRRGQAVVVKLSLDPEGALEGGFEFTPRFAGAVPARTSPGLVGACTNTRTNDVTLFDTQTRAVTGVVATGPSPYGVALDPVAGRAYVALGGQDQLEVVDLVRAEPAGRIPMRAGDEPRALLLLADRRTLLVLNFRSQTAAFVDALTSRELDRVGVGDAPWSVVHQGIGNRAIVVNRRSSSLTVLDLATRQVVATIPTDPEPLFAHASRDGTRLYLVHAGSLFMTEYALPSLAVSRRIRVGLGASTVKLDSRTGLIYVARAQEGRIEVFDAFSALPVDGFDVPGGVSRLAIDDQQDQLFALMPSRRAVAVVDLTSRRLVSVIEVSGDPYQVRLAAERD